MLSDVGKWTKLIFVPTRKVSNSQSNTTHKILTAVCLLVCQKDYFKSYEHTLVNQLVDFFWWNFLDRQCIDQRIIN